MISQIILLRELVLFFTGNELTLGIILAIWLLWTATGSGFFGRLVKFFSNPVLLFLICQFLLVVLLPVTVIFIRTAKAIFSILPGEMTSPILIFMLPLFTLAPVCLIVGLLYPLSCKLLSQIRGNDSSVPGKVYLYEAIGSGVAGFIASIILFRFFENFQIVTIICIVNLSLAVFLGIMLKRNWTTFLIPLSIFMISSMILFFPKLDHCLNQKMWGALKLLLTRTTIYGNIAVTGMDESISFYENGVLMFTHPDLMYAEESVHFALLEHPNPQQVLLIGGDAAGSLPQILFHPTIKHVDFVLIDPNVIRLAERFIPSLTETLKDKRIQVWYQDGRLFLKQTPTQYDVIIINLPEPQTALINRFYTREFYQSAKNKLSEHGILSFSIPSSENVLSDEQTVFLNCLLKTMQQIFHEIVLIPGNSIHYIGCLTSGVLTNDPQVLVQRLQQRQLPTSFVREYYIPYRMAKDRMDYITNKLVQSQLTNINRDFRPIGYFYSIVLWLTYFKIDVESRLHFLVHIGRYVLFLFPVIFFLCWLIVLGRKQQRGKRSILFTITIIGFSAISLEVLIILGFQAIYGYAYYQLALIMSGFMIGLTLGSWYSLNSLIAHQSGWKNFLRVQILLTLYPLVTVGLLTILSKVILPSLLIQILFLGLIAGVGFIGGYQFPLANHLIFQRHDQIESVGGMLYASDLFGSVIGALITSSLFIPILGLGYTSVVFTLINLGVLILLFMNKLK